MDFEVPVGEVFGFLGPNGAGKTTTINMLCTLATPTGGHARVAGHDVVTERDDVRRNIGLVFQDPTLDGYLTASQNLRLHAELYGVPSALVAPRMRQMLEMVGLWERRDVPVKTFSGGMRRRLEIARGLMHSPRVLFLDEPTIGLDPQTRSSIWSYIRLLRETEEITIFMTTHYMDEAEFCDRIAIMDQGAHRRARRSGRAEGGDRRGPRAHPDRRRRGGDRRAGGALRRRGDGVRGRRDLLRRRAARSSCRGCSPSSGVPIRSVNVSRPTLDDVFMSYTGSSIRDAERRRAARSTAW